MIQAAICDSYVQEVLDGVHRGDDTYKLALYEPKASLSVTTTHYTPDGEVISSGYRPGGLVLHDRTCGQSGHVHYVDWANPVWPSVTFSVRGALVYNATRGNKACCVLDFGETLSPAGVPFGVELPPPGPQATIHVGNPR